MQLSWAVQSDERAPPLRPALSGLPHRLNLPAGRRSPEHALTRSWAHVAARDALPHGDGPSICLVNVRGSRAPGDVTLISVRVESKTRLGNVSCGM